MLTHIELQRHEADRKAHIAFERGIDAIGQLFILAGAVCLVPFLFAVIALFKVSTAQDAVVWALVAVAVGGSGIGAIWCGRNLRRHNRTARVVVSVLTTPILAAFPAGTLLGATFWWVLWSPRGRRVFADDYGAVIQATPHVVAPTPGLVWVVAILMVTGLYWLLAWAL